ncbi:MAG TPA: cysteine peptidase family C39 domain-containing protein [Pyrinomonadaceae bacterium]|nr:cysteine peptidase family C39 domain-containing protein [Pyrinomonadaceae bacterium]
MSRRPPYSCVPACLRMVLSGFGLNLTEKRLRELCDCTPTFGTNAWQAVDAVRQLGFPNTGKHTLSLAELRRLVQAGKYPVAFISLEPLSGSEEAHAVVVVRVGTRTVTVYDPLQGEYTLSRQSFAAAWAMRHNLALLVEP